MDKAFIAQGVANRVHASENAVDAAISESSQLLSEMLAARQSLGYAASVGHEAAAKVAQAIAALSEARGALVEAHGELAEVSERLGIRTKMSPIKIPTSSELVRRAG